MKGHLLETGITTAATLGAWSLTEVNIVLTTIILVLTASYWIGKVYYIYKNKGDND